MAYNPDKTFWNSKHPLSAVYQKYYDALVPASGCCATVEGELLRAFSRINHDYYNNGFGNNWSGALNFLDEYLGLKKSERALLKPYSRGKIRDRKKATYEAADPIAEALDGIGTRVVAYVNAQATFTDNHIDMFDMQEKGAW